MSLKFHSTILASTLAATLLVGFASAAMITSHPGAAPKGDRLPIAATAAPSTDYVTVETRHDGVSELARIPVN